MAILTLRERKRRTAEGRRSAFASCLDEMSRHARAHGGKYVIFGSFLADTFRHDSDIDVLIVFPSDTGADPWGFLEGLSRRFEVPIDMHDAAYCKQAFIDRVLAEGKTIA